MEFNTEIMKKLIVLIFILCINFLKAQVSVTVQQPELGVLFANYDNIFIPAAEGADENRIAAEGALVTSTIYHGKKAFKVNPNSGSKIVTIIHEAKINGKWQKFDSVLYKVKRFPIPQILNESVSKTSGAVVEAGYSNDSPIIHDFEVIGLILYINEEVSIVGSTIRPEQMKKIKPGKMIGGTASIKNITTGSETQIAFSLRVTN